MKLNFNMLNALKAVICLLALSFLIVHCGAPPQGQKITFEKYQNLKLGFTTQNFIEVVPVSLENSKKFIDYAAQMGYHWIELRDPDASLTYEECQQIAEYASSKNIEIGYANQRSFIDKDFWEVFKKGLKNAPAFEGPKTIRALVSGQAFIDDENKLGLTAKEFAEIIPIANKAAKMAKDNGLQLVVENGSEVIKGDGQKLFGLTEFYAKVDGNVGWQFDTANFFGSKQPASAADVKAFLETNVSNLFYAHLKASQNNEPQPKLMDNALDFDTIFSIMSSNNVPYFAIELLAIENESEIYGNLKASIDYLKEKGFLAQR